MQGPHFETLESGVVRVTSDTSSTPNDSLRGWGQGLVVLSAVSTGFPAAAASSRGAARGSSQVNSPGPGDLCRLTLGGSRLTHYEPGKSGAGLTLVVIRRDTLRVTFHRRYDTHHHQRAAEALAEDIVSNVLQASSPVASTNGAEGNGYILAISSQYAWEGYFSNEDLCEVLGVCGADRGAARGWALALTLVQKSCSGCSAPPGPGCLPRLGERRLHSLVSPA